MAESLSRRPRRRWTSKPPVGYGIDWSSTAARGLHAAWLGTEGGGPSVYDLVAGNTLVYQGTTNPWIIGPDGPALNFPNSTTNYWQSARAIFDPTTTDFTASIWFRTNAIGVFQNLVSTSDGTGGASSGRGWFGITAAGLLQSNISSSGSSPTVGTTTLAAGAWYHAAMTYQGTTHTLYLNGRAEASGTITAGSNAGTIRVGVSRATTGPLNGAVGRSGLLLWKAALAAGTIQRLATDPFSMIAPPPARRTASSAGGGPWPWFTDNAMTGGYVPMGL